MLGNNPFISRFLLGQTSPLAESTWLLPTSWPLLKLSSLKEDRGAEA